MINRKIDELAVSWDNGDKFGSTMVWWFAVADALELADEEIPIDWQYSSGAIGFPLPCFESDAIVAAVDAGEVSWDDVRELGNALMRYRKILGVRGEDY